MKQVSDGNGSFDNVTLENVAAVCFGYRKTSVYVYLLNSANCEKYLNTKAKDSSKMWRFQRWPVQPL
jgi:hypothetical protein